MAAGAPDNVLCGTGLHELEAIAEGVPLPNQGVDLHFSERQTEFQANHFADGNLHHQHGRNTRLADIHRLSPNHSTVARVDPDVDFQLEPAMAAGFHKFVSLTGPELTIDFHSILRTRSPAGPELPVTHYPECVQRQDESKPNGSLLGSLLSIGTIHREL